jgi:hypothetical protein
MSQQGRCRGGLKGSMRSRFNDEVVPNARFRVPNRGAILVAGTVKATFAAVVARIG